MEAERLSAFLQHLIGLIAIDEWKVIVLAAVNNSLEQKYYSILRIPTTFSNCTDVNDGTVEICKRIRKGCDYI